MIIAQGHDLQQSFGGHILFNHVNFSIQDKARIGLVGPNGAGKTTLLRIMTGQLDPTKGKFTTSSGIACGYIAQENDLNNQQTIFDEMLTVFAKLRQTESKISQLSQQIADHPQNQALLKQYDHLSYAFEQAGGFTYQAQIKSVLNGFHFPQASWDKKIGTLSGGEKTRLSFVKLLLQRPPLLLLDEPTNYLDLDTLDWLESFLKNYDGAILAVSHDQYFLDHLTTEIFELHFGQLTTFKGNYSAYVKQRALRDQTQQAAYEKQQAQIKRDEEFIQKNLVRATTTKRAQSRRKRLEKMDRIQPPKHKRQVRINFSAARPSGKEVLILRQLSVGYQDRLMIKNISLQINQGDRVAVIGPNGIGKSTLVKTIIKQLPALGGEIKYGASLDIGYYDQELKALAPDKTVLDTVWDAHRTMSEADVRSILASFLFTAKDIDKTVAQLSGGQKARLTLTLLSLEHDNFLIMDEPTNHLDIEAKEVLERALQNFNGTLLFVSHDRYFINQLANKIVVIAHQAATMYPGNYSYYLEEKAKQAAAQAKQTANKQAAPQKVSQGKLDYQSQKEHETEKRRLTRAVAAAEKSITHLEQQQADLQNQMAQPEIATNFAKLQPLQAQLQTVQAKLNGENKQWEQAMEALEDFD